MKVVFVLFLCGILLSNAYTIGASPSQPDSALIPYAFAASDISGNWSGTYTADDTNTGCHATGNVSASFTMSGTYTISSGQIIAENISDIPCVPLIEASRNSIHVIS